MCRYIMGRGKTCHGEGVHNTYNSRFRKVKVLIRSHPVHRVVSMVRPHLVDEAESCEFPQNVFLDLLLLVVVASTGCRSAATAATTTAAATSTAAARVGAAVVRGCTLPTVDNPCLATSDSTTMTAAAAAAAAAAHPSPPRRPAEPPSPRHDRNEHPQQPRHPHPITDTAPPHPQACSRRFWGFTLSVATTCESSSNASHARAPPPPSPRPVHGGPPPPSFALSAATCPSELQPRGALASRCSPATPAHCDLSPHTTTNHAGSAIIGELDQDVDSQADLSVVRAEPLKPVAH